MNQTHPKTLPTKKLQQWRKDEAFCVGFSREREIFGFPKGFSDFLFIYLFFSISVSEYTSASHPFKEVASIGVSWYTNASLPSYSPYHKLFCLFLIFVSIFVRLLGGLSKLRFLQNLYARKSLDVLFLMVLTLFDLELQSSRYRAQKEGDTKPRNFELLFLKNSYLSI